MRKDALNPYVLTGEALLALAVFYGCSVAAVPTETDISPSTQPTPEETTPVPADTASPTGLMTAEETGTMAVATEAMMATDTGTPEFPVDVSIDASCGINPNVKLFQNPDASLEYGTVPMLSEAGMSAILGRDENGQPREYLAIKSEVDAIIKALAASRNGLKTTIFLADILANDFQDEPMPDSVTLQAWDKDLIMSGDDTFLIELPASPYPYGYGRSMPQVWGAGESGSIEVKTDPATGRYFVEGILYAIGPDGNYWQVPAQQDSQDGVNLRPEIMIVDPDGPGGVGSCLPSIVRVDSNGTVHSVFGGFQENPLNPNVWIENSNFGQAETVLPEGLQKLVPPGGAVKSETGENGVNWTVISDAGGNEIYLIDQKVLDIAEQLSGMLIEGSVVSAGKDADGQEWINVENDGQAIFRVAPEAPAGENGSFPAQILLEGKWVEATVIKNENAGLTARVNDENGWNFEWINGEWLWKAPEFIVLPDTLEEVLVIDGNWEEVLAQVQPAEEYSLQNRLFYRATAEGVISEGKDLQLIPYNPEHIEYVNVAGQEFGLGYLQNNFGSRRNLWPVSAFKVNLEQGDFLVIGVAIGEPGITPDITAEKIIHLAIDIGDGALPPGIVDMNKQIGARDTVENVFMLLSSRDISLYAFHLSYSGSLKYAGPDMRALQTQAQPVIREWYNRRIMPDEAQKILFPAGYFFIKK